ncbi:PbsX family transcriptional regulator [Caballeronia sp. GAWG2-1]|uniref:AbrB/MazE/SpoVT family DNA-binding domain-containing protein n=1 Tax=Caballeronia sp. GAWG2-1 TaxID=2921744 RepID=UPI00202933B8|nr:PbsX family transcriptional regulator [Caballeronia sp. GAWG2-1]
MELSIRKQGNGAAVRLPAALLKGMKRTLGDKFNVEVCSEGIMPMPARREYSLEELLAQCDPKAPISDELADWNNPKPVGRELW